MKRKVFLAVALVALMAVGAFAQTESDFEVTKSGNAITITKYKGTATVVNIPSRIQNTPVTTIGDSAFMRTRSTSVTIPSGVTSIGRFAFRESSTLASVTIPATVTSIGDDAFLYCTALTSVTFQGTIPASGIHANAFRDDGDLRDKFLAGGAGTYTRSGSGRTAVWTKQGAVSQTPASQYAAESDFGCTKEGNSVTITAYRGNGGVVNIPSTIQGSLVTAIGNNAFMSTSNVTSVTIPSGVTSIGRGAFAECQNLTSVTIPASVTSIGSSAFEANLTSVTFQGTIPASGLNNNAFYDLGDLRAKYLAGGAGTYTRSGNTWTKK
ncbi:MAG: leucine-rich repeat domain-containing protein [Treponema sp.]|nr:leucine-rich repeat domain-containing protein [Treponema sp.]